MYYTEIISFKEGKKERIHHTNWNSAINFAKGASKLAELLEKDGLIQRHPMVDGCISHTDTYCDMYVEFAIEIKKEG